MNPLGRFLLVRRQLQVVVDEDTLDDQYLVFCFDFTTRFRD
jgi:hypothetical protein